MFKNSVSRKYHCGLILLPQPHMQELSNAFLRAETSDLFPEQFEKNLVGPVSVKQASHEA